MDEICAYMVVDEKELAEEPYHQLISIHSRIELILVEINRSKIDRGVEIWKPMPCS